ncbi:NhaD2 [Desulforapulum autotrophicum HRM2]|uniref:NhaD2 n=1 Tax=Desulforapulum autotrophicum (strain ATCC 43914 / DSM 3382 / VKM B-1955 / HRM2) TaxID=177437 RepID=C0QL17_DESAH|nr:sodium:proton antiporter NhaD [Desulforapulum autotrophicum]ACN14103.1 NhaD2 [Desulforapulum autotrophicum HRM2]
MKKVLCLLTAFLAVPVLALASSPTPGTSELVDFTRTIYGYLGIGLFVAAYCLVPLENIIHLRKSKPVLLAAGIIWILVALAYMGIGDTHSAHEAIKDSLLEYGELFLFLLAAMTYINAMEERKVFQALRAFLVSKGFSLRVLFWITGLLAFVISPVADNLTTALLMGAVVMSVGGDNKKFVALSCINIVIGANAGGAYSPFGDITTLMVWQNGKVAFSQFFDLFIPSLVNWLVPAVCMSLAIGNASPKVLDEKVEMKYGAQVMIGLFILTIITAVSFHNFLNLPPAAGMMLGLGYLGFFSYHIKRREGRMFYYDNILGARNKNTIKRSMSMLQDKTHGEVAQVIDDLPTPAFLLNKDHVITHWNPAMAALTGISAKDKIGTKDQWKSFYPQVRPLLADMVLEGGSKKLVNKFYHGKSRLNKYIDSAYEVSDFEPSLGEKGKWVYFASAPLKDENGHVSGVIEIIEDMNEDQETRTFFDIMESISRAEWDTLLFFYGVTLCVGGLGQFGYLGLVSTFMYGDLGATAANTLVGVLSAVVDNIPVMFAVLKMNPAMSHGQWLLVTLTAGVGGSLLSIGSAAGVALMGSARGIYTFGAHLKWMPVIALGYGASILVHLFINSRLM